MKATAATSRGQGPQALTARKLYRVAEQVKALPHLTMACLDSMF
jgi:hypothetical protein